MSKPFLSSDPYGSFTQFCLSWCLGHLIHVLSTARILQPWSATSSWPKIYAKQTTDRFLKLFFKHTGLYSKFVINIIFVNNNFFTVLTTQNVYSKIAFWNSINQIYNKQTFSRRANLYNLQPSPPLYLAHEALPREHTESQIGREGVVYSKNCFQAVNIRHYIRLWSWADLPLNLVQLCMDFMTSGNKRNHLVTWFLHLYNSNKTIMVSQHECEEAIDMKCTSHIARLCKWNTLLALLLERVPQQSGPVCLESPAQLRGQLWKSSALRNDHPR